MKPSDGGRRGSPGGPASHHQLVPAANHRWTSVHDQYTTLDMLGHGTYGVVYKAQNIATGEIVAMKRCRLDAFREFGIPETTLREITLLRDLRHENVMTLYRVSCNTERIYMICEFLDLDLKKYLRANPQGIALRKVKEITYEIFKGLAFCHGHRVIHRDLKPNNVLVSADASRVKLADFGLARSALAPGKTLTHEVVTLWYRAPELLLGHCNYTSGVDIWSAGCIVSELLSTRPLFVGDSEIDTILKIFRLLGTPSKRHWPKHAVVPWVEFPTFPGKACPFKSLSTDLDDVGCDFLRQLFQFDSASRLTALEALNHPWLEEIHQSYPPEKRMVPEWREWLVDEKNTVPACSSFEDEEGSDRLTLNKAGGGRVPSSISAVAGMSTVDLCTVCDPVKHQVPLLEQEDNLAASQHEMKGMKQNLSKGVGSEGGGGGDSRQSSSTTANGGSTMETDEPDGGGGAKLHSRPLDSSQQQQQPQGHNPSELNQNVNVIYTSQQSSGYQTADAVGAEIVSRHEQLPTGAAAASVGSDDVICAKDEEGMIVITTGKVGAEDEGAMVFLRERQRRPPPQNISNKINNLQPPLYEDLSLMDDIMIPAAPQHVVSRKTTTTGNKTTVPTPPQQQTVAVSSRPVVPMIGSKLSRVTRGGGVGPQTCRGPDQGRGLPELLGRIRRSSLGSFIVDRRRRKDGGGDKTDRGVGNETDRQHVPAEPAPKPVTRRAAAPKQQQPAAQAVAKQQVHPPQREGFSRAGGWGKRHRKHEEAGGLLRRSMPSSHELPESGPAPPPPPLQLEACTERQPAVVRRTSTDRAGRCRCGGGRNDCAYCLAAAQNANHGGGTDDAVDWAGLADRHNNRRGISGANSRRNWDIYYREDDQRILPQHHKLYDQNEGNGKLASRVDDPYYYYYHPPPQQLGVCEQGCGRGYQPGLRQYAGRYYSSDDYSTTNNTNNRRSSSDTFYSTSDDAYSRGIGPDPAAVRGAGAGVPKSSHYQNHGGGGGGGDSTAYGFAGSVSSSARSDGVEFQSYWDGSVTGPGSSALALDVEINLRHQSDLFRGRNNRAVFQPSTDQGRSYDVATDRWKRTSSYSDSMARESLARLNMQLAANASLRSTSSDSRKPPSSGRLRPLDWSSRRLSVSRVRRERYDGGDERGNPSQPTNLPGVGEIPSSWCRVSTTRAGGSQAATTGVNGDMSVKIAGGARSGLYVNPQNNTLGAGVGGSRFVGSYVPSASDVKFTGGFRGDGGERPHRGRWPTGYGTKRHTIESSSVSRP